MYVRICHEYRSPDGIYEKHINGSVPLHINDYELPATKSLLRLEWGFHGSMTEAFRRQYQQNVLSPSPRALLRPVPGLADAFCPLDPPPGNSPRRENARTLVQPEDIPHSVLHFRQVFRKDCERNHIGISPEREVTHGIAPQ